MVSSCQLQNSDSNLSLNLDTSHIRPHLPLNRLKRFTLFNLNSGSQDSILTNSNGWIPDGDPLTLFSDLLIYVYWMKFLKNIVGITFSNILEFCSVKKALMRDFRRDSLFCFNKKESLIKSLSHRCSSFLSENLKRIDKIVRQSNKKWKKLVSRHLLIKNS